MISDSAETTDSIAEIAERLCPDTVSRVIPLSAGGNNRLFKVISARRAYALKFYPETPNDHAERFRHETAALTVLQRMEPARTARLVAADRDGNAILMEWVDGEPAGAAEARDIEQMASFVAALADLSASDSLPEIPNAVEACLSGAEIGRQLADRRARFDSVTAEPALDAFFDNEMFPAMDTILATARGDLGRDWDRELPRGAQVLSPSDFGLHNAVRAPGGDLVFVDFEYFGWDDPVKLIADTWWHPGIDWTPAQADRFVSMVLAAAAEPAAVTERLRAFFPLFGLRWIFIILGDFLPDRQRRRIAAGLAATDAGIKANQLGKAKSLLRRLQKSDWSWAAPR